MHLHRCVFLFFYRRLSGGGCAILWENLISKAPFYYKMMFSKHYKKMFCENIYHICQSRFNSLNTNDIKTDRCTQEREYLPAHLPVYCLFLNKVDTLKSTIMKKKEEQLQISLDRVKLQKHVYELCRVQKLTINEVRKKTGLGMGTIYRYLHTFEEENQKLVEQMKKQGPNIIPEDYKKLQEEVLRLKCELKRERLRADFYEEMVAFGKEVYGIDLKKAGTK